MTIQVQFWDLVGLLLAFLAAVATTMKLFLVQFEKGLDQRFEALEEARREATKHWDAKFNALEAAARDEAGQWQRVERDLLLLKAEMPLHYVRREDYIRGQSVIEAKLDALFQKIENMQLRGGGGNG
jgi:hypothetical protein